MSNLKGKKKEIVIDWGMNGLGSTPEIGIDDNYTKKVRGIKGIDLYGTDDSEVSAATGIQFHQDNEDVPLSVSVSGEQEQLADVYIQVELTPTAWQWLPSSKTFRNTYV